jgi:SPP1 family predicted phage head-tail adaptor
VPLASGEMRHRVTLYAPEGTRDVGSPDEIDTGIPAKIEALPPAFQQQERLAAGGVRAQTVYTVTIRYRDDVTEDLQLVEECCMERTFHILSIVPDDKLTEIAITCVVGPRAAV